MDWQWLFFVKAFPVNDASRHCEAELWVLSSPLLPEIRFFPPRQKNESCLIHLNQGFSREMDVSFHGQYLHLNSFLGLMN